MSTKLDKEAITGVSGSGVGIAKQRLSLADFFYKDKHATGLQMPILLPSGEDSGETLNIIGPDCDSAVQSGRAYTRAIFALDESLQELEAACKESGNFFEYNTQRSDAVSELNIEFAINIVTGWSFENEFTKESFSELLHQFPGLAQQISDFHTNSREKLYAK